MRRQPRHLFSWSWPSRWLIRPAHLLVLAIITSAAFLLISQVHPFAPASVHLVDLLKAPATFAHQDLEIQGGVSAINLGGSDCDMGGPLNRASPIHGFFVALPAPGGASVYPHERLWVYPQAPLERVAHGQVVHIRGQVRFASPYVGCPPSWYVDAEQIQFSNSSIGQ